MSPLDRLARSLTAAERLSKELNRERLKYARAAALGDRSAREKYRAITAAYNEALDNLECIELAITAESNELSAGRYPGSA